MAQPHPNTRISHLHAPTQKSTGRPGERAYRVGDVDILGGPRLDELAANEEANPRLRESGVTGEPDVRTRAANREQARRQIGMGT
jgi:hypothetical protein